MLQRRQFLAAAALGAAAQSGFAAEDRKAFLTIRGQLGRYTNEKQGVYRFSEAEFMALKQSSITTSTTWTPKSKFDGPLLSDVLKHVGAHGAKLDILALDDYSITVPISDLAKYGVILAHSRDGKRMTVNSFGPTWLVYPRDKFPEELNSAATQAKFIWQVSRITVVK